MRVLEIPVTSYYFLFSFYDGKIALKHFLYFFFIPQDPKLRQLVNLGSSVDMLEEKTVSMVFGTDFVNLTFINFCCTKKELAKVSKNISRSLDANSSLFLVYGNGFFE